MNKLLVKIACILGLSALSLTAANNEYYTIIKVNKGTQFLKPGQSLAGYLDRKTVCEAQGTGMGAEACAVVSAQVPPHFKRGVTIPGTQTFYYLKEVYITGTPAPNLMGFIEGSSKKGKGMGGDKAMGVFQANNLPRTPQPVLSESPDGKSSIDDVINVRPSDACPVNI